MEFVMRSIRPVATTGLALFLCAGAAADVFPTGPHAANNTIPFASAYTHHQVFASTLFSGASGGLPVAISSIALAPGVNITYSAGLTVRLGYTNAIPGAAAGSGGLQGPVLGGGGAPNAVGAMTDFYVNPAFSQTFTGAASTNFQMVFASAAPFTYDPAQGNLLVEFVVASPVGSLSVSRAAGSAESSRAYTLTTPTTSTTTALRMDFSFVPVSTNEPGACCFADGTCTFVTFANCQAASGVFRGVNVTCASANCPQPGACCFADGTCTFVLESACTTGGGVYSGAGVTCATANCPQPGACCFANGTCTFVLASACTVAGGTFSGAGITCATANCPQPPQGACCDNDGHCALANVFVCTAANGAWMGPNTTCAVTCPVAIISNFPGNDGTQSAGLEGGRIKAMGFSLPAGTNYTLNQVQLRLDFLSTAEQPVITLYDDVAGAPSTLLSTLAGPPVTATGTQTYTVAPPSPVVLQNGQTYWVVVWNSNASGDLDWKASSPAQTPTGIASHAGSLFSTTTGPTPPPASATSTTINTYIVRGTPVSVGCYPNCDGSTIAPILNVGDFTCFLQRFAAGESYANCDNSTVPPVLNVGDFTCFLQSFAAGCP
jgi:hypothetical protein